jgi:hypothetical protein
VGGQDDTRIRMQRLGPTDALEFILLQNPEDLDLSGEWELTHFVKENCAFRRSLEASGLPAVGAGEGAALVAEQLTLNEPFVKSTAVDTDEWSTGTIGVTMKRGGDELLASATLAEDQDWRISGGGQTDRFVDLVHRRALADQFGVGAGDLVGRFAVVVAATSS